ncbi:MAG TPA: hypothetical protein EYQ06_08630 [Flavobacteriales bacterium]|jgi:hypothetical protein|nr:hypothetical protein [Flavobacteriales bacterium]HIK63284.1 hypothetical protein [Flavobacteriales bacterium]|tara:strand:+ start:3356 stop:3583 length:228 start_codon:yes stop_codon:yes gene_type:complete
MPVILSFGYGEDILLIISFLIFILLFLFKKKILFQFLAKLNKLILPSLYKKDMKKLKKVEMLIIAYRYWVTKNAI